MSIVPHVPTFPHQEAVIIPSPTANPYQMSNRRYVHRLVVQQAFPDLPHRFVVDHIDGCKWNNHPGNLRIFESQRQHIERHQTFMQECRRGWRALRRATGIPTLDRFTARMFAWLIWDAARDATGDIGPRYTPNVEEIEPAAIAPDDELMCDLLDQIPPIAGYRIGANG
jgi:hypothetical protein